VRFIQHKQEAYWFYRVVSLVYDRWVNPLFWTPAMRDRALELARLEGDVVDVGAGTGFTTEGIVARIPATAVTMLDQSPHQLARAREKPALAACDTLLGDAERLPFDTDRFDRYVSAGSIEYWPDPLRGIAEAYRVLKPGGRALVIGPVRPANPIARRLAEAWMLFPSEEEYLAWMQRAGFDGVEVVRLAPDWYTSDDAPFAVAVAGSKPIGGASPAVLPGPIEPPRAAPTPVRLARFALGSLAGLGFVPLALAMTARARLRCASGEGRS
jgi:MPBQ/MSBQ methyltransferase